MTDEASAKSTVDRLTLLQRLTLVRFVMDLSGLDGGGGSERSRRYGEHEGEGKEEVK
jgi:hypothetical protein